MPREFAGFTILEEVGRGNTGIVYRGINLRLNREVALKLLITGSTQERDLRVRRFVREARVMASLVPDPNIPAIYALEEDLGQRYLIREFVDGRTFRDAVMQGSITTEEGIRICGTIAGVLERIHQCGFVHRNLFPENILIARDGIPKLIGFSQARPWNEQAASCNPVVFDDVQSLQIMLDWLFTTSKQPWPDWLESVRPSISVRSSEELKQVLTAGAAPTRRKPSNTEQH